MKKAIALLNAIAQCIFGDYGKQSGDGETAITVDEQRTPAALKIAEFIGVNLS